MRIVAALGGNALLRRGEAMTADNQRRNVRVAAEALAPIVADGQQLIITHGNGPQVGLLALQAAAGPEDGAYPLDILDAESEGMIGYMIEQEMRNALPSGPQVTTLLTQIRVDADDPAFDNPTKPIGPVYDRATGRRLAQDRGWQIAPERDGWRRVVASPLPIEILEIDVISLLVDAGVVVVCAGGGGIPVYRDTDGAIVGVEAVIDKDRASALLARTLKADHLLLLTDVDAVYEDWNRPGARAIRSARCDDFVLDDLAAGSMRPKVEAAIEFVRETGKCATIGNLADVDAILRNEAGTRITA